MDRIKRPCLRRILKWAGLVGCVVILASWGVSLRVWVGYQGENLDFNCSHGVIQIDAGPGLFPHGWNLTWHGDSLSKTHGFHWITYASGREVEGGPPYVIVEVPFWLPLLAVAIPTAILFYRDRRRFPPGHCRQCGYDLTGNESGKCPECGTTCQVQGETE